MIIIIIIILIPIILFSLMDSYFGDRTNEYVTLKSQNVATKTITKVLDEYLLKDYEKNDIIEITYQNEGNNHFLFLDCLPSQIILERDFLEIGDYLIYFIS